MCTKKNSNNWRSVFVVLLATAGLAAAAKGPSSAQSVVESPSNPCLVYGSVEMPRQNAQLFTIDLQQNTTQLLGAFLPKAHIPGLAVNPFTGDLYALVVNQTGAKLTSLAYVDTVTGAMALIGTTGLDRVEGLSFRPTDATLWAWWREHGLVRIDPSTAAAELVQEADLEVSGLALAWDPAGAVLYLAAKRSLWAYESGSDTVRLVAEPLPLSVGGLAMRGDGQLLLTAAHAGEHGLDLLVFDPALGTVAATLPALAIPVDTDRRRDAVAAKVEALTWPIACGNPSPGGEAELIQSIEIDKSEVCSGQMVHVEVGTIHPEGAGNAVLVSINGQLGNERTLQLHGNPGPRLINVSAWTAEGYADRESRTVELMDCGPVEPFVILSVGTNAFHPYTVDLLVANANDIAPPGTLYEWDFGDGSLEVNDVPFVSHSYEHILQPDQEYSTFEVAVKLHLPDGTMLTTADTIVILNAYAADRQRGLIRPRTFYEPELVLFGLQLRGEYTLINLEDSPIMLTGRQKELQYCDPSREPVMLPWEAISLTLGPGDAMTDTLLLDVNTVDANVCGIALHFAGEAGPGRQVATDLYFQIMKNPLFMQPVTDQATLAMLNEVAAQGLVRDMNYITDEELSRLSYEGRVVLPPSTVAVATSSRMRAKMAIAGTEDESECDKIGCECSPGDTPPRDGISCQATEDFYRLAPHLANALKGDVIIVGGCGFVGEMLGVLNQSYVHTGIMTENYVEIAHSTSTDKRANEHQNYLPLPHIDEDVLRYGWPGMIREDVGTAFSPVRLTDPDGDTYLFTDFTSEPSGCPGNIVPPLVVKPPAALAQSARPTLHEAADIAADNSTAVYNSFIGTGTGHYRFYSYTKANISRDPTDNHPPNEPATVCSSFVWYSLKTAGATLEGSLEPDDFKKGARVNLNTHDGLYLYPEHLRRSAAEFSWSSIHNIVMDESWFDPLYDVVADGIANQVVNCFIFDDCGCSAITHQGWKNPGIGWAVSPEDILYWDPPTDADEDGTIDYGVYGYSEPLVYRSGGWKRLHRWAASPGTGTVTGVVIYKGPLGEDAQPMAGARVILHAAGVLEAESGPDGRFEFVAVPAGTYQIEAQKLLQDVLLSSDPCLGLVTVPAGGTADVTLELLHPPDESRKVIIEGWFCHQDTKWSYQFPFFAKKTVRVNCGPVVGPGTACYVDPYDVNESNFFWWHPLGDSVLGIFGTCTYCYGSEEYDKDGVLLDLYVTIDSQIDEFKQQYLPPGDSIEIEAYLEEKDMTWYSWPHYGWDIAAVELTVTNDVQK